MAALRDTTLPRAYFDEDVGGVLCDPDLMNYIPLSLRIFSLMTVTRIELERDEGMSKRKAGGRGEGRCIFLLILMRLRRICARVL